MAGTRLSPERALASSASRAALQGPADAARAQRLHPRHLGPLDLGVDAEDVARGLLPLLLEAVDADDHALARLDLPLVAVGRLLDLALHVAPLDGGERPAARLDLVDEPQRLPLERVGRRLDRVAAAERVHGVGHARLVGHHLLRAQREPGRGLGGKGEGLVAPVRVQALAAAQRRGEGLQRDAHHVVVRLLGGEGHAARLDVEAALLRLRVRDAESLLHEPGPEPPRAAELRHLLQEVGVAGEEEREPLAEAVGVEPGRLRRAHVGDRVREGERELLGRRRPRLADVVAGDRDRVPLRHAGLAVGEEVGDQAHRRRGRVDPRPARHVLLEDVVLHRARERRLRDAPPARQRDVEGEEDRRRGVDRHRRGDPVERDGVEERSMSSRLSIATPTLPTSPSACGSSES